MTKYLLLTALLVAPAFSQTGRMLDPRAFASGPQLPTFCAPGQVFALNTATGLTPSFCNYYASWTSFYGACHATYDFATQGTGAAATYTPGVVARQNTHAYAAGAFVTDTIGHIQTVTTAGTSGGSTPTWNDSGPLRENQATTSDGSVTWTDSGIGNYDNCQIPANAIIRDAEINWTTQAAGSGVSFAIGVNGTGGGTAIIQAATVVASLTGLVQAVPVPQTVSTHKKITTLGNVTFTISGGTATAGHCEVWVFYVLSPV